MGFADACPRCREQGEYAATRRETGVLVGLTGVVALCTVGLAVFAFQ